MVEVPSLFSRVDFIGKVLPGYILITTYLFLFKSNALFGATPLLSVDLFTAIVFVIAGPAFGFAITKFQRSLPAIKNAIPPKKDQKYKLWLNKYTSSYGLLRAKMNTEDRAELDLTEAELRFHNFCGYCILNTGRA